MNRLYDKMFQYNIELEVKPLIDEYGHRYAMFTFRSDYDQNLTSKSTTAIVNMDDVILESDDVLELLNNYLDGLIKALDKESEE